MVNLSFYHLVIEVLNLYFMYLSHETLVFLMVTGSGTVSFCVAVSNVFILVALYTERRLAVVSTYYVPLFISMILLCRMG